MRGPEDLICDSYTLLESERNMKEKFFQIISFLKDYEITPIIEE